MKLYEYGIRKATYLTNHELYKELTEVKDPLTELTNKEQSEEEKFLFMPQHKWEKIAYDFFNSINDPHNPVYWSTQKWEYDENVNKELNDFVNTPNITFDKILDFAFERCLKYLKCHPAKSPYSHKKFDIHGTVGNSKPDQYEFAFFDFILCAQSKLFDKYNLEIRYEEDLGYGHIAYREIAFRNRFWRIDVDETKLAKFTLDWKPRIVGDNGFHDEMRDKLQGVKSELLEYKKNSKYLNTPLIKLLSETTIL